MARSPMATLTAAEVAGLPVADVYAALVSAPGGLSSAVAGRRREEVGPNALPHVRGTPLLAKLLANFTHVMALLLWVGGFVGFIAGLPQLGVAIWLVNIINGAFSFWQEYKAERATLALARLLPVQVRVQRDGTERRIAAEEIVPGDVILLAEGDHIPADARLVEEAELRVDQSTLTGEADAVRKTADPVRDPGAAE
ncbi:MAG TPA: cation-transporting P-type ATPase, partial [Candidatus Deferrimicrobium sp.]|nr:cation-transporting P-type ATPase [Candidatus Deferrimicrobium sp.]